MRRAAALLVAVFTASCGAAGDTGLPPVLGTVTLGTITDDPSAFIPLSGDATMVAGAQGGFHVWLKYRVAGIPAGAVTVRRTARRVADGKAILITEGAVDMEPLAADGTWQTPAALPNFMCPAPLGVQVYDELLEFTVEVVDATGVVIATGSAQVTPHCPDGDEHDTCISICAG